MTHDLDDGDLRERFRILRDHVERAAPSFQRPAHRPSRLRKAPTWAAAAVLATLVIVAVWVAVRSDSPSTQSLVALDATWWVAPTDFLLTTPGADLLRSVPSIGVEVSAPEDPVPLVTDTAERTERTRS